MLRHLAASLTLLVTFASTAAAQISEAAQAPSRPTAAQFAAAPTFFGATLSPSGRYVAGIRRSPEKDDIVVLDRETGQWTGVAAAVDTGTLDAASFGWVGWKSDDLLLFGVEWTYVPARRTASGDYRNSVNDYIEVHAMSRSGGNRMPLYRGRYGGLEDWQRGDPDHVIVSGIDDGVLSLRRIHVANGKYERLERGSRNTGGWLFDADGQPVLRLDSISSNGGVRYFRRAPGAARWTPFLELRNAAAVNVTEFMPFAAAPGTGRVYVAARPDGRDKTALFAFDTATGSYGAPIFVHPEADIASAVIDPVSREALAVCAVAKRFECLGRDRDIDRNMKAIATFFGLEARIDFIGMSADRGVWLLLVSGQGEPGAYYTYETVQRRVTPLMVRHGALADAGFPRAIVVDYKARDGAALWGYLTNGPSPGGPPAPLVIIPHGGPEGQDGAGFDYFAQFIATRGYAVFRPNFRGGAGFGRAFTEAGYREWGRRMQDDVSDAVAHLVNAGIADPARICIVGASYGGYAALAGAAFTPELYRCAVSIAGVSDLREMLVFQRVSEGGASAGYDYWKKSIGDPGEDRDRLLATSPRHHAAQVRAPVLLIHGLADDTVPVDQSRMMARALLEAGKQVTVREFAYAGHAMDLWSDRNEAEMLMEIEAFLARHLAAPPAQ